MYSIGSFQNYQDAKTVLQELSRHGIPEDEVSFVASMDGDQTQQGDQQVEVEGVGAAVGRGRLADALRWDPDILGALQDEGLRRERAELYAESLRRGGAIVLVVGEERDVEEATEVMTERGAMDINRRAEEWRREGWRGFDVKAGPARPEERGRQTVPIIEEQLQVGKERQEREMEVRTSVEERPVEQEVRLREERAKVEQHSENRPATEEEKQQAFKEQSFRVNETIERPVVEKQAKVTGEVEIGKEASERTEKVQDTVRRTKVETETKQVPPRKK